MELVATVKTRFIIELEQSQYDNKVKLTVHDSV